MVFRGLPRACCSFGGGATGSNIESLRQTNQNEREMNRAISTVPAAPLRAPPQTESAEVHASAGREAPAIAPLVGAMRSCRPVEGRSAVRRCGEETREEWLRSDALGGRGLVRMEARALSVPHAASACRQIVSAVRADGPGLSFFGIPVPAAFSRRTRGQRRPDLDSRRRKSTPKRLPQAPGPRSWTRSGAGMGAG
jgi:hypothetical protein